MSSNVLAGLAGFVAGTATGYILLPMAIGQFSVGGGKNFAVMLINTGTSPGLVAPSYTYPNGSTVQTTVFAASNNPNVNPTAVTGYYSSAPNGSFKAGQSFTWDVSQTGNAFTFNYGTISGPASVYVYAVVQFSDGSTAQTNTLFIQVSGS